MSPTTDGNGIPEGSSTHDLDHLSRLQSTFTRPRPPPIHISPEVAERVPLKPPKIQRKESRGGLRGIFSRNKPDKSVVSPVSEETITAFRPTISSPISVMEPLQSFPTSSRFAPTIFSPPLPTPITPSAKSSRSIQRSSTVKQAKGKATPKSPKPSSKSGKMPARTSPTWDPPPLFQAYPQAIKYAQLSASTLSADSILRISNHRRNHSLRDEIAQIRPGGEEQDQSTPGVKKTDKSKSKHRRQASGSISKSEWTQKIYVLVTSGYLLQYAGDGSFDRLPEKMMQLGKDSVAFASDVIPGKHWVLQISQAMDADGAPASDSRSLLSRLAFRGADYRRTATSLLLVLNSAEDMDSWLAVLRREIESLGGKKHASETGKPQPDDNIVELKSQPSHRYLVQRHPDQFSTPTSPSTTPPWDKEEDDMLPAEISEITAPRLSQSIARPSTGQQSVSNSIASRDGQQLENLRDSTNRYSYVSSGQRTLITSQGSSPPSSPTRNSIPTFDDPPSGFAVEDIKLRPNAAAINERRRSMQTIQVQGLEAKLPAKKYRHSTYGGPTTKPAMMHSLGTPNFSVPNSSSKRYSTMKGPLAVGNRLPPIVTAGPSPPRDAPSNDKSLNGPSVPPTANDLPHESADAALSKIVMLPSEDLSVLEHPSRPQRMASLLPLRPRPSPLLDFQFPRKSPSLQVIRREEGSTSEEPQRSFPSPQVAVSPKSSSPPTDEIKSEQPNNTHSATYVSATTSPSPHTLLPSSLECSPKSKPAQRDPLSESGNETVSALPVVANTKKKVCRPASVQVQATPSSPTSNGVNSPRFRFFPHPASLPSSPQSKRFRPTSMQDQPLTASLRLERILLKSPLEQSNEQLARSTQHLVSSPPSLELDSASPLPPPMVPLPKIPSSLPLPSAGRSTTTNNGTLSPAASPFIMSSKPSPSMLSSAPSTLNNFTPLTPPASPFPPQQAFPPSTNNTTLQNIPSSTPTPTLLPSSLDYNKSLPAFRRLKARNRLSSRRSVPVLVGPPPAPPPNCALPPLPPSGAHRSMSRDGMSNQF